MLQVTNLTQIQDRCVISITLPSHSKQPYHSDRVWLSLMG